MSLHPIPQKIEPCSKEVQVVFGGVYIAKTCSPLLVWEHTSKPSSYYLPVESLMHKNLKLEPYHQDDGDSGSTESKSENEQGADNAPQMFELIAGEERTIITLFRAGVLKGYMRLKFEDMDAWLENGALTRLPPKNPSRRIDTAVTAAHITVTIGNTLVADADYAIILFETGLPSRYYAPATSVVDWRILKGKRGSGVEKVTACPYKGEARYFDVEIDGQRWEDVVWYYLYPMGESAAIVGKLCFEVGRPGVCVRIDNIELDK